MASFWFSNVPGSVLDAQLEYIRDNAERLVLLNNYSLGDAYATVVAGNNIIASVAINSTDFDAIADAAGDARRLPVQAQTATASNSSSTPDLHVAILKDSATSEVLVVVDETSDQAITAGNPVNFAAWYVEATQPVSV